MKEDISIWPVCDVEGCELNASSGGSHWRETGYWSICQKHSLDAFAGKPQPIMKYKAVERENSRLPNGYLPIKD